MLIQILLLVHASSAELDSLASTGCRAASVAANWPPTGQFHSCDVTDSCSLGHSGGLPDPSPLSVRPLVPSAGLLRPLWRDAVGSGAPRPQV